MPGWPGSWKVGSGELKLPSRLCRYGPRPAPATPALAAEGGFQRALAPSRRRPLHRSQQNHGLAASQLEVERLEERSAAVVTRRFPAFKFDAIANRLLKSMDFPFNAGVFGTYPETGPIPATNTSVSVPTGFSGTVTATIAQPIIQQYRIGLNLEAVRLDQAVAQEDLRKDRQRVVAEVKSSYYKVSAIEAGVIALRDLVRAIEDVDGLTGRYLTEGRVLRSEALEVKARLARERQRLSSLESELATQHEHLNQLLGRDLRTAFRVTDPSEVVASRAVLPLEEARQLAVEKRPEIRKVGLQIEQAENARRIAISHWIPDLTLLGTYVAELQLPGAPQGDPDGGSVAELGAVGLGAAGSRGRRAEGGRGQGAASTTGNRGEGRGRGGAALARGEGRRGAARGRPTLGGSRQGLPRRPPEQVSRGREAAERRPRGPGPAVRGPA